LLLHDLAKRTEPAFFGKDHIHPFLSGKIVLEVFKELNIIKIAGT